MSEVSPKVSSPKGAMVASRLLAAHGSPGTHARSKHKALLVDDVKVTQRVTRAALHQAGFQCDVVGDGESAVEMAQKVPYFVILMDVQLPKMDGVEATKFIRAFEAKTPERTPSVIFGLTGACKEEDLERYLDCGMDGCIEKGCIVSRAMHEALAMKKENPNEFAFINSRNVQSIRTKKDVVMSTSEESSDICVDLEKKADISTGLPTDEMEHVLEKIPVSRDSFATPPLPSVVPVTKKRALLVDDVKVTQKITSVALAKTGYTCDLAADGQSAVDLFKTNSYNVVLMDVQLPVMNGVEATRLIRQYERRTGQKACLIFGLTGSCSDEDLRTYAEAGMDGCIEKGCVVSRAMHEAIAMKEQNPCVFMFIDSRNVHFHLEDKLKAVEDVSTMTD